MSKTAAKPLQMAVLGSPIQHSLSPLLHRGANHLLGLPAIDYGRFELTADELAEFLDTHEHFAGFSVTMPLKTELLNIARQRVWTIDDTAALTGVANTWVAGATGQAAQVLNTDVIGIQAALGPYCPPGATVTVLGGGATAASAVVAVHRLGATQLTLQVRNPARAAHTLNIAASLGMTVEHADLQALRPADVMISTLPAEAAAAIPEPASLLAEVVLDVAYAADSPLLQVAMSQDAVAIPGTVMLVEQAAVQFHAFRQSAGMPVPPVAQIAGAMYRTLVQTAH